MNEIDTKDETKVVDERLFCEKHGDVTEAAWHFRYTTVDPKTLRRTVNDNYYCLECLDELFKKLQEEGKIARLELRRYVDDEKDTPTE